MHVPQTDYESITASRTLGPINQKEYHNTRTTRIDQMFVCTVRGQVRGINIVEEERRWSVYKVVKFHFNRERRSDELHAN